MLCIILGRSTEFVGTALVAWTILEELIGSDLDNEIFKEDLYIFILIVSTFSTSLSQDYF